jgi:DDE superfamily endonuclease
LTLLLFDGLADNCLVEVANDWTRLETGLTTSDNFHKEMKQHLLLLKAASQQYKVMDEDTSLDTMLEKFLVGTEKIKKKRLMPQGHPKILKSIRTMDFSSAYKKAEQKIYGKKTSVNTNNNQNDNETVLISDIEEQTTTQQQIPTFIPASTYQRIVKCIVAFHKCIRGYDIKMLEDSVGYDILQKRAYPISFEQPGKISTIKRHCLRLIELANTSDRSTKKRSNISKVSTNDDDNEDEDESSSTPEPRYESPTKAKQKIKKQQPKVRRTCCVCSTTSINTPNATFTRVPYSQINPLDPDSSNKVRKTYYHHKHKIHEFYHITGLKLNDKRVDKRICHLHPLVDKRLIYCWIDEKNERKRDVGLFSLPDMNATKQIQSDVEEVVLTDESEPNNNRVIHDNTLPQNETDDNNSIVTDDNSINTTSSNDSSTITRTNIKQYINRRTCNFGKCRHAVHNGAKLRRIPKKPNWVSDKNYDRMAFTVRKVHRNICLRRSGLCLNEKRNDIRICERHQTEKIKKDVEWLDNDGEPRICKTIMYIPTSDATRSIRSTEQNLSLQQTMIRPNKGLGTDRRLIRQVGMFRQSVFDSRGQAEGEATLLLTQVLEQSEGNTDQINPVVAQTMGLTNTTKPERLRVKFSRCTTMRRNDGNDDNMQETKRVVRLSDLNKIMIKAFTGFSTVMSFLSFIVIICEGSIEEMETTTTKLTWLEEWLLYFEAIWCKHSGRWLDLQLRYNVSPKLLRGVFDNKLNKHLRARKTWPSYVYHHEDLSIRKNGWNESYGHRRIIMWDNTSLPICQPSCAEAQRNTYSKYYAGNVAKGGVFIQPCGWIGTKELWAGAISDSEYMEKSGILQEHETYQKTIDNIGKSFTIIVDKGYRINKPAWKMGKQFVLQPAFSRKSDVKFKFTALQSIRSAAIAADRSANERAVRLAKTSDYVSRGLLAHESSERLDNVWLAWGFQINFIYKPVL